MQLAVRSRVVSFEVWRRSTVLVCAANGEQEVKGRHTNVSDQLHKYVINFALVSYLDVSLTVQLYMSKYTGLFD